MKQTNPAAGARGRVGGTLRWAWEAVARRAFLDITITEPPDGVVVQRNVAVTVRDGTRLRVNVFRPADDQPHPALLCLHPYGKDRMPRRRRLRAGYRPPFQYHLMQTEPLQFSAWTTWEAPDPAYWLSRGYAVVNADLRGFGTSDGEAELLSEHEGTDGHDLVEWIAAQSWCTGKVGMNGVSYLAVSQWSTAATRPPHLAAICPWEAFTDFYRDFARPGGIRENGFMFVWNSAFRSAGYHPDLFAQTRRRPLDDPWYAARNPKLEDVDVPALICASFSDHNLHTRGSFEAHRRTGSSRKWLYTHRGQKWATYYSPEGLAAQTRFFDHFLRGQDTSLNDDAPVRVEVREDAQTVTAVHHTTTWPPPHTQWRDLHLSGDAHATDSNPVDGTLTPAVPLNPVGATFDIARGNLRYWYRFDADTEVVGPMLLRLEIDVAGTDDVTLFAGIRKFRHGHEIVFNGSYGFPADLVTHGMLLAPTERSTPPDPSHTSRSTPTPPASYWCRVSASSYRSSSCPPRPCSAPASTSASTFRATGSFPATPSPGSFHPPTTCPRARAPAPSTPEASPCRQPNRLLNRQRRFCNRKGVSGGFHQ